MKSQIKLSLKQYMILNENEAWIEVIALNHGETTLAFQKFLYALEIFEYKYFVEQLNNIGALEHAGKNWSLYQRLLNCATHNIQDAALLLKYRAFILDSDGEILVGTNSIIKFDKMTESCREYFAEIHGTEYDYDCFDIGILLNPTSTSQKYKYF